MYMVAYKCFSCANSDLIYNGSYRQQKFWESIILKTQFIIAPEFWK